MLHIQHTFIKYLLLIYILLLLINMTIYSLETLVGIWHANFRSVAHLHWKKGKRWEAFWSLLKTELRGDEFLSLGPRCNWFSTQWLTGATFTTLSSRRMEMHPKVQLLLRISPQSAPSLRGRRDWATPPFYPLSKCADRGTCPAFSSHSENWALAFLFSVARCQKHLFSDLDHKVREEHRQAHHEIHINIITALSEFTVAMSTKQLGKLGLWESGKWGWLWQHGKCFLLSEQLLCDTSQPFSTYSFSSLSVGKQWPLRFGIRVCLCPEGSNRNKPLPPFSPIYIGFWSQSELQMDWKWILYPALQL